jgi:hypothetical protein
MTKNYNPIEFIKNKEQEFTAEMINDTLKYQKQYGFKIGKNNLAWNNESDAFRHTYMQSVLSKRYGSWFATQLSTAHEKQGSKKGQDPREANMDLWNNRQGQQIYNEICKEYPNFKSLPETQQKDIIAQKVVQRMKSGKLITGLDDTRQFKNSPNLPFTPTRGVGAVLNNGSATGFATSIDNLYNIDQSMYSGYRNPLTGSNKIYTREDVGNMSPAEFASNEKEIDAQIQAFDGTMPTNQELQSETTKLFGGVVYVNSYTRSDGTKVRGYYRSR